MSESDCRTRRCEPGFFTHTAERQDPSYSGKSYSGNERFLRAQDAELVPLGVGEHGPRLRAAVPDVDPARAERDNPFNPRRRGPQGPGARSRCRRLFAEPLFGLHAWSRMTALVPVRFERAREDKVWSCPVPTSSTILKPN